MRKGWEIKKLGEVCEFRNGQAHENSIVEDGDYILINSKFISSDGISYKKTNDALSPLLKGDITMVMSDVPNGKALAKCFIVDNNDRFTLNQRICAIRSKSFDIKFLFYQLNRNNYFLEFDNGENQTNLRKNDILNCLLWVPPLSEQKRIVSILDHAFAAIDKVKANTEKNLQNAKALFESYLQKMFEERGKDWEEKRLGEICHIIGGGTPSKDNKRYYTGSIYWATVRDMKNDLIADTEYQITDEAVKQSATNIIPKGNVVIATRVGLGKACLLIHDTAINQDLKGVIPKKGSNLSVEFLFRWFKRISKHIIEAGTGATVQGVKLTFINSLIISYPTLKKQRRIIESIDQVEKETQKLILKYQQKLISLDELKKSILQKAFSGQLSESRIFAD